MHALNFTKEGTGKYLGPALEILGQDCSFACPADELFAPCFSHLGSPI